MNYASAQRAIAQFLVDHWTTTPVSWPNVLPTPASGDPAQQLPFEGQSFVAVRNVGRGSRTLTMGSRQDQLTVPANCIQGSGQLLLAAFTKVGTGTRQSAEMVDALIALFENAILRGSSGDGTVRFGNYTGPAEYEAQNGWYVMELGLIYQFERVSVPQLQ